MRVIRNRRRFYATARFWVLLTVVLLFLVPLVVYGQTLRPERVPQSLIDESVNATVIYEGGCQRGTQVVLCLVGYDKEKNIVWLLLFNNAGVLYQVININAAGHETVRWTHPLLVI